ncbi:MAG: DUF3276 family protein [Bacteroidia bacterium]|nr:DUF3276 family protein [Bacteroidia bacterium]
MENVDSKDGIKSQDSKFRQEIYSKVVRAGKRTYFFDVKSTRNDEYYLTITESKKRYSDNGRMEYEKHKIFLYREDFDKFTRCMQDIFDFIDENQPEIMISERAEEVAVEEEAGIDYTNVDFDEI